MMEKMPGDDKQVPDAGTEEKKKGRRICAWCNKDMGEAEAGEKNTHGICEECNAAVEKELEELEKK